MFHLILRPCEAIQAIRENLVLPSETLSEARVVYLNISGPKSRWCGPRIQHASSRDPTLIRLLETRCSLLKAGAKLFDGSAATYRKTWNQLLHAFGVPLVKYTPASLRGGGCCFAYEQNPDITSLLWRMRISSISILKHYLQEVVATASLSSLHPEIRNKLLAASNSFNVSSMRIASETYAAGTSVSLSVAASAASDHARDRRTLPPAQ